MTAPKRSTIAAFMWWLLMMSALLTAGYLSTICLFSPNGVLAQSSQPADRERSLSATPTPHVPSREQPVSVEVQSPDQPALQIKLAELDARTNEMSKRIEETGNHASRVVSLIGLLVGFITGVVAIGLWQSKHYIDRVVEQYKTEMRSFIREETDQRLNEIETAMVSQFDEALAKTIEELDKTREAALKDLETRSADVGANLNLLSEDRMESHLRLGAMLIDRLPQIYDKALDSAVNKGLLTAAERASSKEEMEFAVYAQKEILQGLMQLESPQVSEVIAGCQKLSALQDRTCLPALKLALSKWSGKDDQRAVEQISAAYEKLIATQVPE